MIANFIQRPAEVDLLIPGWSGVRDFIRDLAIGREEKKQTNKQANSGK